MNYAWVDENGYPVWLDSLPKVFKNISGFDTLDSATQLVHGIYPVVQVKPFFDPRTHWQSGPVVEVGSTEITATWTNHEHDLVNVKGWQIQRTRQEAQDVILAKYPVYKQLNRTVPGRFTEQEITDMDAFIDGVRDACNTAEAAILAATTGEAVLAAGVVVWPI